MANFSKSQRLYLYKFCADMIEANLPLYDSVDKLRQEGKTLLGAGFVKKLTSFQEKMATAESVSGVFDGFVQKHELSVIYSSEKSGSLAEGFNTIVKMINFRDQLRSKLIKAMAFPMIMLVLSLVVVGGYALKVFPLFAAVIPIEKWPGITSSLYSFGTALAHGLWLILLIGFVVVVLAVRFTLANVSGGLRDRFLDRIIPFTTYKKMTSSMFLNSLSSMLRNNIPLNDSLGIIQMNAGRWLRVHIEKMRANMTVGMSYGDALNTGLLGGGELLNISLYASLPSFYDVLMSVSEKSSVAIDNSITSLSSLLKSLSTLVLGGCVIWVFLALYALMDEISTMTHY